MQMSEISEAYDRLISQFVSWAQSEDNVRLAMVIGSRARLDHPADDWSDLDVIIFARDPEPYWQPTGWLHQIGTPWLTFIESTPDGRGFERRVMFEGGLDVDFVPGRVTDLQAMLDHGFPPDIADMIHRGVRFLVDKDGFAEQVQTSKLNLPRYQPPAEGEFLNLVNDFWYHTVWTGKHLRRGELWWAKSCCDGYLKNILRQVMEWHTRTLIGEDVDTWLRGRFLEEWVDVRALEALPAVFAHYDDEDVWRALMATMDLFRRLAVETSEKLGYPYPSSGEEHAVALVQKLFSERNRP
jgi:aminoglycoside 6-adenylyltransferase